MIQRSQCLLWPGTWYQITTIHTIFLLSNNYYSYLPTQFPVKIQHILTLFPHPQKLRCYVIKITWTSASWISQSSSRILPWSVTSVHKECKSSQLDVSCSCNLNHWLFWNWFDCCYCKIIHEFRNTFSCVLDLKLLDFKLR